jgi:hypothetical protein
MSSVTESASRNFKLFLERMSTALTLLGIAQHERITLESDEAHAHRRVTYDPTVGINSARTRARIAAFLIDTRQMRGTLAVTDAFRSTVRRIVDEFWQAGARRCVVYDLTSTVESTGGWIAGINRDWRLRRCQIQRNERNTIFHLTISVT